MRRQARQEGFTLIEVITVAAILGVLLAMALVFCEPKNTPAPPPTISKVAIVPGSTLLYENNPTLFAVTVELSGNAQIRTSVKVEIQEKDPFYDDVLHTLSVTIEKDQKIGAQIFLLTCLDGPKWDLKGAGISEDEFRHSIHAEIEVFGFNPTSPDYSISCSTGGHPAYSIGETVIDEKVQKVPGFDELVEEAGAEVTGE